MIVQELLEFAGAGANRLAAVVGEIAQLMGCHDDGLNAVGGGHGGHQQRLLPRLGAIIDSGNQMTVNVHEGIVIDHRPGRLLPILPSGNEAGGV